MKHNNLILLGFLFLSSCQFKVSSQGSNSSSIISGLVSPLLGSIAQYENSFFLNSSYAALCSNPVYARLYTLNDSGSINDGDWRASQTLGSDARYSFNLKDLGLSVGDPTVKYLVRVEGCNGEIYQRPVTDFDNKQDVNYRTTAVSHIIGVDSSVLSKTLNEADRSEVKNLIDQVSGSTRADALNSLTSEASLVSLFTTIFGASPSAILNSRPQVILNSPSSNLNELQVQAFSVQPFHADPNYSFVYRWKLDGVLKSSSVNWNYIPSANDQGQHFVELFVGKNDGSNDIDLTRSYYHKSFYVTVNNNIMATPPAISINTGTPTPRKVDSVDIDIQTGASFANCETFSEMALTESSTPPGPMTYTLTCLNNGIQTESFGLTNTDGTKRVYLWVRDRAGNVSLPSFVDLVLDQTAPLLSLNVPSLLKGGATTTLNYSISDTTAVTASLEYASDGVTFSFVKSLSSASTSTSVTVPSDNSSSAKYRIVATDIATNSSTVSTSAFTVDSLAPSVPVITLHSNLYNQNTTVALTAATCAGDVAALLVNEGTQPLSSESGWQSCSVVAGAITYAVSGEGTHTLKVWAKDMAGNVSLLSRDLATFLDLTGPVLGLSTVPILVKGGASLSLTATLTELHASNTQSVSFEFYNGSTWEDLGTSTISNGPLSSVGFTKSVTIPVVSTDQAKVRATYVDMSGRSTTATSDIFTVDSNAPILSAFSINSGVTTTNNNNVQISALITDTHSTVTHFCLRHTNTTTPVDSDSCWRAVNATPPGLAIAPTVNLVDYYWSLGFGAATYNVLIWAKDSAGNISTLTAAGLGTIGTDRWTIDYTPGTPPVVTDLIATNKDDPTNPPDHSSDLVTGANTSVVIKWKATDTEGFTATPISIAYSTDDVNFTQIASGLVNSSNGGCIVNHASTSVDDSATGCYVWVGGNPGTYFKIKVTATDLSGQAASSVSVPLNSGNVKFLAGNTDVGINASASAGLFQNWTTNIDTPDVGTLAISPSGIVFFLDPYRGLLRVDPSDGLLRLFIPINGNSTGDGGPAGSASLKNPHRIALGYNNNLLIRDCDRIREINLTTNVITTKIGGGASNADGLDPLDVSLGCNGRFSTKRSLLTPLPNGDILFSYSNAASSPGNITTIKRYVASSNLITSFSLTGTGTNISSTQNLIDCSISDVGIGIDTATSQISSLQSGVTYDASQPGCYNSKLIVRATNYNPTTGVAQPPFSPPPLASGLAGGMFTGLDGRIYLLSRITARIYQYKLNPTGITSDWITLVGTGTRGICDDGTLATSCAIEASTAFVSSTGKLFFVDRGQVRFVDDESKVRTLMGQRFSFGDGALASSARFGVLESLTVSNSGEIAVIDSSEALIRSFVPGGNITTIAGNGYNVAPISLTDASSQSILVSNGGRNLADIHVEPSTGDIYYMPDGLRVSRLDRATNQWIYLVGNGGTGYEAADGLNGVDVKTNFTARNRIMAYDPASAQMFVHWSWDQPSVGGTNIMIKKYDGSDNYHQSHLAGQLGLPTGSCSSGVLSETCPLAYGAVINGQYDSINNRLFVNSGSQSIGILKPGSNYQVGVTLSNIARSFVYKKIGADEWIYYCDSTNGVLKKQRLTDGSSTTLSWPSSSLKCAGNKSALRWHPNGNLLFIYTQDNLYGVAEYINP